MAQSRLIETAPLTPFARRLVGVTVTGLRRLSAVMADGVIPLPGTLVLETDTGFVTLSYTQDGLSCRGPLRRDEIRWDTEPGLAMNSDHAEEWLDLTALDDTATLPLFVEELTGWFGVGAYVDTFALILAGRGRTLVLMTTDDFDLRCATRQEADERAEAVAAAMNLRRVVNSELFR